MRFERIIYGLLIILCAGFAALNWRKAALFQADNDSLRARSESLENQIADSARTADVIKTTSEKLHGQTTELAKLRNEVTQLRTTAKTVEALTTENQRLRAENQQLHVRAAPAGAQPAQDNLAGHDQFPRNSWNFAGYSTPEAALVSAIWAMREGDPKTYLNSLAPDEQQRVAQNWQTENKTEAEVAEKHKNDVAAITGLRVVSRDNVGPNEMVMGVYIEGPNRMEKVRMNQVGQDWKFGGYIRDPQPAPAPAPVPAEAIVPK